MRQLLSNPAFSVALLALTAACAVRARDVPLTGKSLNCPLHFITAAVPDGHGGAWAAGEDHGLAHYYRRSPNQPYHWRVFNKGDVPGLASNFITALCLDGRGRLWAGTDRHGVCVLDGKQWAHYGLLNGPLGSHIYAISWNRRYGQVWICTEAGISIYQTTEPSQRTIRNRFPLRTWHYITPANGLPPNPDCAAFDSHGTAFVGTQCDGLAASRYPYRRWRVLRGPPRMGETAFGHGLPSSLINCILVTPQNQVLVGTDLGLAVSTNDGRSFRYERGADYAAKVQGLWQAPSQFRGPLPSFLDRLLPGDHVTCLAQDGWGNIWLGTWRNGWTVLKKGTTLRLASQSRYQPPLTVQSLFRRSPPKTAKPHVDKYIRRYVTQICFLKPSRGPQLALIGHYGAGVSALSLPRAASGGLPPPRVAVSPRRPVPMPAAAPPTRRQLLACCQRLLRNNPALRPRAPAALALPDDWRTQGAWLGRYGCYWACLFACDSPEDYVWAPGPIPLDHRDAIGPHGPKGDSVRFWVQWLATSNPHVLELPEVYLDSRVVKGLTTWKVDRREAEIDDNGEAIPTTFQGPDLYVLLRVPPGRYTLSLYLFNKDGHYGANMNRDYLVCIIPLPSMFPFVISHRINTVPLAEYTFRGTVDSRVLNFWGGVWKRFLVRGPMKLAIRVAKNYSLNTILAGAMLDPLAEHPAPYYFGEKAWPAEQAYRAKLRARFIAWWRRGGLAHELPKRMSGPLAMRLLQMLGVLRYSDPGVWAACERSGYTLLWRWCVNHYGAIPHDPGAAFIVEKCCYELDLFTRWEAVEKSRGILTSRQIEKGLRWNGWSDSYRGREFAAIRRYVKQLKEGAKATQP